ncbi:bifunctional diguanylate cyclase/phosphodiesterase [Thiomonas sp. FB-6]|uniref:putative bifunctional diguanylate cyclase/phosphodiesterase n=1 Tax=Thiomonas sp. FB-6 TaxID=1158291 RepID=UPI00039E12EE|nr:EAL domain-containing protein [Thiomonas sp. FB-6]
MQVKLIANPGKCIDVGILLIIASATTVALLRFPEYRLGLIPTRKLLPPAVLLLTFAGLVMAIFSRFIWLRRRLREKIAHKILFFTALILIFSGGGAGFLATIFMGGYSEHALKYHLQQDNDRLASTLNQEIAKRRQEIAALAKDQRLKSLLGGGVGIDSQYNGLQDAVEDRAQQISPDWLALRNAEGQLKFQLGNVTASDRGLPLRWGYLGQAWLLRDPHSLQFLVRVREPIRSNGFVFGFLEAILPLQSDHFSELALHESNPGHTVVVCARGPAGALCLPGLANENPEFITDRQLQSNGPEFRALRAEHGVVIRPSRQQNGHAGPMIVAYAPVGNTGLGMVSQISARELFRSLIATSRMVLLLIPIILITGLGLLYWQLRPMVRELYDSQQRVRIALDYSGVGMMLFGKDGRIQEANNALLALLGFSEDELRRLPSVLSLLHPDDLEKGAGSVAAIFTELSGGYCAQRRYRRKSDDFIWVRLHVAPIFGEHGSASFAIVFVQDVNEVLGKADALRRNHTFLQAVLDNMTDGVVACDERGYIQYTNALIDCQHERVNRSIGLDEWASGHKLLHPDRRPASLTERPLSRAFHGEIVSGAEFLAHSGKGDLRQLQISSYPLYDERRDFVGAVAISRDVTEIRTAHARAHWMAFHDSLTELPNRNKLLEYIGQAMARARGSKKEVALLMIGIDRFKAINDALGHVVGDQLLVQVSARLRSILREGELLAHLGSEEFAVVLEYMHDVHASIERAEQVCRAFESPLVLGAREIQVSTHVGIARYPADGDDVSAVFSRADIAMHEAKKKGAAQWSLYRRGLYARQRQVLEMEGALRRALNTSEFVPYYQAKVDIATDRIIGAEALLRWKHPEQGLVAPVEFIPILEETGLIVPAGKWVLNAVCAQQAQWRREGVAIVPIAVNCAVAQLQDDQFINDAQNALQRHSLDPSLLEIEITESVLMQAPEKIARLIEKLRGLGILTGIDDFGTGYSSLAYLKSLPVSSLKIDRAFVKDLPMGVRDMAITKAVLSLARELGLRVVAEGVENMGQFEFLRCHGCDAYQGYLFSRPVPAGDFAALLQKNGPMISIS